MRNQPDCSLVGRALRSEINWVVRTHSAPDWRERNSYEQRAVYSSAAKDGSWSNIPIALASHRLSQLKMIVFPADRRRRPIRCTLGDEPPFAPRRSSRVSDKWMQTRESLLHRRSPWRAAESVACWHRAGQRCMYSCERYTDRPNRSCASRLKRPSQHQGHGSDLCPRRMHYSRDNPLLIALSVRPRTSPTEQSPARGWMPAVLQRDSA